MSRMILFILEFAVRYLMVPGRVENWVLIVELLASLLRGAKRGTNVITNFEAE